MNRTIILSVLLAGMLVFSAGPTFAQWQQRVQQPIIVNGQQTEGVTVLQNGTVQTFSCPSPQPYTTADGSSGGLACFDQSTGTWLMDALPSQSSGAYPEESPGYYYGYQGVTPYYPNDDYYPYGFFGGPEFGFFGFRGDREFHERRGEERRKPEPGGFEHGRGGFEHGGSFEHGGHGHEGSHMGGGGGHVGGGGGHVGGGGGHAGGGHAGGGHR